MSDPATKVRSSHAKRLKNDTDQIKQIFNQLGQALELLGRYEQALAVLEPALERYPNHTELLQAAAFTNRRFGRIGAVVFRRVIGGRVPGEFDEVRPEVRRDGVQRF